MAGIDNIVKEILQEAEAAAQGILDEAQEKAKQLMKEAAAADDKAAAAVRQKAEKTVSDLAQRAVSQSALRKRQAVLKAIIKIKNNFFIKNLTP